MRKYNYVYLRAYNFTSGRDGINATSDVLTYNPVVFHP